MERNEQRPQPNRDLLLEMGYGDFTYLDEYDWAMVGIDLDNRVVYDHGKMVQCLMNDNDWDEETALDWIGYNTIRALPYIPNHPYIFWETEDLDETLPNCAAVLGVDVDDRVVFDLERMMAICGCGQEEAIRKIRKMPRKEGQEPIIVRMIRQKRPMSIRDMYTPVVRYRQLLKLSEDVWGHKLQPGKAYENLKIRWFVSYMMWKEGYTYSDIGRAMGRHYSSVINHVKHMFNVFDEPVFYAEENAKFAQFSDMVAELDSE